MLYYFLLGVLQGIFEWIPISSEAIVALASRVFIKDFNPVDVALFSHLGTTFACIFYFWDDIKDLLFLKNKKLFEFLAISTISSLMIGFFLYKIVKNIAFGNHLLILIGFGLLLTAFFHKKKIVFKIEEQKLALFAGILQGISVIPGVSRSGATIFALSLGKFSPSEILKISYLMSIPAVLASSLFLFFENKNLAFESLPALISSFFVGFLTLKLLLSFSGKINFFKFAIFFALLCFGGAILNFFI